MFEGRAKSCAQLSQKAKMFASDIRNMFTAKTMFPTRETLPVKMKGIIQDVVYAMFYGFVLAATSRN